jgi:hypothetical protein
MTDIAGRVAVVTGGGSGVGQALQAWSRDRGRGRRSPILVTSTPQAVRTDPDVGTKTWLATSTTRTPDSGAFTTIRFQAESSEWARPRVAYFLLRRPASTAMMLPVT